MCSARNRVAAADHRVPDIARRYVRRPHHWQAYGSLEHSVRTGENAFVAVHGQSVWDYFAEHPDEQKALDAAMTSLSRAVSNAVVDSCHFGRSGTIVDVGGGRRLLLSANLTRYPSVQVVLFDQPAVVAGAREPVAAAGVSGRCEVVGGSFFDSVPPGGDAHAVRLHELGTVFFG